MLGEVDQRAYENFPVKPVCTFPGSSGLDTQNLFVTLGGTLICQKRLPQRAATRNLCHTGVVPVLHAIVRISPLACVSLNPKP